MMQKVKGRRKKWYRLDTAALIFPAIIRRDWCNVFRLSVTLNEPVDPVILQEATDSMKTRFPSFFVTLRKGFFWQYLEESESRVEVKPDYAYPLTFMNSRELRENCLRIFYYENRIAVEFFHVLSDGRGGSIFLSNLTARYLELKYGLTISKNNVIRDLTVPPSKEELEDSFLKNGAGTAAKRDTVSAYHLHGSREKRGFRHLITGVIDTKKLLDAAHHYHVSVTAFLTAVMAESIMKIQDKEKPRKRQKPVRITIPVDLRRLYNSKTLRNFSLVLNIGPDPRFGDYTIEELCLHMYHELHTYAERQYMAGMIAANVIPQRVAALRLAPLFIKNIVLNMVYQVSGERNGCLNISNLTNLDLPEEMLPYVSRAEFIIGPQRTYPNNCSVLSLNGTTCINMIRNIRESELERLFFSRLVELGIPVEIESNRPQKDL